MKRLSIISLVWITILSSCSTSTSDTSQKEDTSEASFVSPWSEQENQQFKSDCEKLAQEMKSEGHMVYCECLLKTVSQSYPDHNNTHNLTQSQWVDLLISSDCHDDEFTEDYGSGWDVPSSEAFLEGCKTSELANGSSAETADTFCNCALDQIKEKIPNPQYSSQVTQEEMQEILAACR